MPDVTAGTGWRMEEDLEPAVAAAREASAVDAAPVAEFAFKASEFDIAAMDPRPLWPAIPQDYSDCQGHAVMAAGQAAFTLAVGRMMKFSPWFAYIMSQKQDSGGSGRDNGSTITGGLRVAEKIGFCPESDCPYPSRYHDRITQAMLDAAAPYKIKNHAIHRSYNDVLAWCLSGQGGSWWGTRHGFTGPGGNVLTEWHPGPPHATTFLAPSTRKDDQGRHFIWMYNSGYPTPGYYEISAAAIDQAFRDRFTVCAGLTDLTTPTPRPIVFTDPFG